VVQRLSRRAHVACSRPAFAGFPGRVAMRGRHVAELTYTLTRILRANLGARDRRLAQLERQLATFDVGRRLAAIRTRLVRADGRLTATIAARRHRAVAQLQSAAARLDSLSPLAVLARGYAVAWNADKTRVLRDAAAVTPGDTVQVTLSAGELKCEVRATFDARQSTEHEPEER
jgi:exodeoxyribonuclease VII large subunit